MPVSRAAGQEGQKAIQSIVARCAVIYPGPYFACVFRAIWPGLKIEVDDESPEDQNTTVVFPAPLMTTIAELGSFLAGGNAAGLPATPVIPPGLQPAANGASANRSAASGPSGTGTPQAG